MAFIPINTGTGPKILVDTIGTDSAQVIKLGIGASGTSSILAYGQATMTGSIPVVVASNQSTIPVNVVAFTPGGTQTVTLVGTPTVTVSTMPVLSATGVTIASVTTGTCDVRFITSTVNAGAFVMTAPVTAWNATVVCTTSGVATVIKASGAHTLYVTDLMVSVNGPNTVTWNSDSTVKGTAYLATNGGFALNLRTPAVLNSAQSLTIILSSSGSGAGFAAGYTVT